MCIVLVFFSNTVHSCHALRETDIDLNHKVYRGACTVQDWSNTTACPDQWCNNGKDCFHCQRWGLLLTIQKPFIDTLATHIDYASSAKKHVV